MGAIVPAILPKSRLDLEEKLARLSEVEGIDCVQVDVVDGKFAAPPTWPYAEKGSVFPEGETFPYLGKLAFEMDLMVTHPEEVIGPWITLGASRMTVHVGSTNFLPKLLDDAHHKFGYDKDFAPDLLSFGLAIGVSTDFAVLDPHIARADYVQFMGIRTIGKQGEPFDRDVLKRIEQFRKRYPDMTIQVDGGVTLATAPDLLSAGVDRLVIGHALTGAPDIKEAFDAFTTLTEHYGIYE